MNRTIFDQISQVSGENMYETIYHLSRDPLPFRKLNHTRPGSDRCSLYEADAFLQSRLASFGYAVETEGVQVQAFRCDTSKPKAQQYSAPAPEDPWYPAYNLYAEQRGSTLPEEIVLLLAHKDSQSWVDSPGANDNGVGTAAVLEIARVIGSFKPRRTIRFLFCNEEHRPWTSVTAAKNAAARGDNLVAIYNLDGLSRGTPEDKAQGRKTNVTLFTESEGERFADLMAEMNEAYGIGLQQRKLKRERPGDDDGSFVNAGFKHAVINIGSYPYGDPNYHTESDQIEHVDVGNLVLATRLSLAAALHVSEG
ncbi:MAG: M28 family peptidase [bacterium]|nr:M28 family peptidase [bacterium]